MKRVVIVCLLLICLKMSHAQFTLDGQYRARFELRDGFKRPILETQKPAAFVEHRARLIAGYKKDKVGFRMSIQDVRIWGETGQINKSDNLLSVHEAYGDFYASEKSTFRIGRQELIYDDHRLIGSLDWAMQARSFDAIRYMYKTEKTQFDLVAIWNQEGFGDNLPEPVKLTGATYTPTSGVNDYRIFNLALPKTEQMAYLKQTLSIGDIALMLLSDVYSVNDTSTEKYNDFTIGLTPNFKFGSLKIGGQFYYTMGSAGKTYDGPTATYNKISLSGYMFNVYAQLPDLIASPLFGIDYLSGDDVSTTDKVEGWAPKYGTNHKFYGFMDYFYVGNPHGGVDARSAGLMDIYLKTSFKCGDKTKFMGDLHYFSSVEERISGADKYKGGLGTEVDLVLTHSFTPEIQLALGYSQMLGITKTMKLLKNGNPDAKTAGLQNWCWASISFSPKFL